MPNITPLKDSFNRGELTPKVWMRSDAEFYQDGVRTMQNFIPVPRGAARRRSGFRYLGRVALEDNTLQVFPQTAVVVIETPPVDVTLA